MNDYNLNAADVLQYSVSFPEGFEAPAVVERTERYRSPSLPENKGIRRLMIHLCQNINSLLYILIVAEVLTAVLAENTDTDAIVAVVIYNFHAAFQEDISLQHARAESLTAVEWPGIARVALTDVAVVEIDKFIHRRRAG